MTSQRALCHKQTGSKHSVTKHLLLYVDEFLGSSRHSAGQFQGNSAEKKYQQFALNCLFLSLYFFFSFILLTGDSMALRAICKNTHS